MPYGIAKSVGGDTETADSKMERCVQDVMKSGYTKESAIKICKSRIQKSLKSKQKGK